MRKPPKAILPIIELASREETTVEELISVMKLADKEQLKRNAFHVLQAVPPDVNIRADSLIKFAAVHHVIESDSMVFGSITDTCARGRMPDKEASKVIKYLIDSGWMPKVPGLFINSCAYGKRICAEQCFELGLYPSGGVDWSYFSRYFDDAKMLQMTKLLIDIAKPSRDDLLKLRLAMHEQPTAISFLDQHLDLLVMNTSETCRH